MHLIHGTKRGKRETIGKEYERWSNNHVSMIWENSPPCHARFGWDDEAFLLVYPAAIKSVAALVDTICGKHGWWHCSKNGTYNERSSSSPLLSAWFKSYYWASSKIQKCLSIHIHFKLETLTVVGFLLIMLLLVPYIVFLGYSNLYCKIITVQLDHCWRTR